MCVDNTTQLHSVCVCVRERVKNIFLSDAPPPPPPPQLYMRAKQEDKRRRLQADRLAGERASQERQQRLKELYETQRKKVLVNLRRKQQEREAYARSISASVRITLHTSGTTSVRSLYSSSIYICMYIVTPNWKVIWS